MGTPFTDGLVLWLESISGVLTSNSIITVWQDLSGNGNDLDVVAGDPTFESGITPTGASAVVFDGTDDALSRLGDIAGMPSGGEARTIFVVSRYETTNSWSGFAYGTASSNQAFGLVASPSDELILQGWGRNNDFNSGQQAIESGWIVHSVVYENGVFSVYRDGVLIDAGEHDFDTVVNRIVLGQNIGNGGENGMSVSAVMAYDSALSVNERLQTEAYLRETYIGDNGIDDAPLTMLDTFTVTNAAVVSLDVLDNDFDDAGFDLSSVSVVSGPSHGTITGVNTLTGEVNYQWSGSGTIDNFSYQVADSAGNLSEVTTVTINLTATGPFDTSGFVQETIISEGLGQPLSIAFLPDNRMIVIEKDGRILIADPETGNTSLYMQITNINSGNERGLLDITLDPDFANNGYFYLYYTPGSPQKAQISRFVHEENSGGLSSTGDLSSETVLWSDTDGYTSCCHYGGGLDFGPDGKLWLTTSDKFDTSTPGEGSGDGNLPVDLTSTSGKIIRINSDGSIPDGLDGWPPNPYIDAAGDPDGVIPDSIWSYGLRNPFRARWDLETGNFYVAEVGGNQAGLSSDSVHIVSLDQPGVFYGWPFYEGVTDVLVNPNEEDLRLQFPLPDGDLGDPANGDFYSSPIFSYDRQSGASITGGFVYRGDMFPEEWDGVYFYGDYTRDFIHFLHLDPTGEVVLGDYEFKPTGNLPGATPNIVFLDQGNDGALYYINFSATGGQITRVSYDQGTSAPVIENFTISETATPDTYSFTATVSDIDNDALTYVLQFGDGTSVSGSPDANGLISIEHAFTTEGNYPISLQVSDGTYTVYSQPQTITVGDPNDAPIIETIDSDTLTVEPDIAVNFTASVSDPDNDAMTYTWFFGDGTSESGSVGTDGQLSISHAFDQDGTYNVLLEVSDGQLTTLSDQMTISVGATTGIPVSDGLVLILESTIKIGLYGDTVTGWLDGSGNGNNLGSTGDPQYVLDATPSGQPAIVFDGDGDSLYRDNTTTTPIAGLPSGQGARSFFLVVEYQPGNDAHAGFAYGNSRADETFGLINYGRYNQLAVQGWGGANDNRSNVNAGDAGWIVQSVVMQDDGSYIHYVNGVEVDSGQNDFDTVVNRLVIGANIGNYGETAMSVAAVAGYDRALTEAERLAVEGYLQDTYLNTGPPVTYAPVASNDSYTATVDEVLLASVAVGLLANDTDADGDPLSVIEINGVAVSDGDTVALTNGDLLIGADGHFTFTPDAGFEGQQSFEYTVADGVDGIDTATVSITYEAPVANVPPVASDDQYTLAADTIFTSGAAEGLLANDVDPDGTVLTLTAINGTAVSDGDTVSLANGDLTIQSDGQFSFTPQSGYVGTQSFSYAVADSDGDIDTATVDLVVDAPPPNAPPVATDDQYTLTADTIFTSGAAEGLLANDVDPDGTVLTLTAINGAAVSDGDIVSLANGDLTIQSDGQFSFTPQSGYVGTQAFSYTVADSEGDIDTASVSLDVQAPLSGVPVTDGLVLQVEATENVALVAGSNTVSGWLDGSGFGNDLFATGDPQYVENATPSGASAIYLDGNGDSIVREGGDNLSHLPSGSDDRTVFFVVDYISASRMLGLTYGDDRPNEAFGVTAASNNRLAVQGWGRRNDFVSTTSAGDNDGVDEWMVQSVILSADQISHYLNGVLIDSATHTFATDTVNASSRLVIGEEIAHLGFGELSVAAVLIYDRALTEAERAAVEAYLQDTYLTVPSSLASEDFAKAPVMEAQFTDFDLVSLDPELPVLEGVPFDVSHVGFQTIDSFDFSRIRIDENHPFIEPDFAPSTNSVGVSAASNTALSAPGFAGEVILPDDIIPYHFWTDDFSVNWELA